MDGCDDPEGLFDAELFVDKSYTTQSISFVHTTVEVEALHNASSTDYDLTGQIIWPASMLLSTHIEKCSGRYKDCRILELGAGVGVAGLVSAKLSTEPSKVVLTDHNDHVLKILQNNIDHNFKQCPNGQPKAAILNWGDDLKAFYEAHGDFDIIIGADVVFWPDAVPLLFETVGFFMKRNEGAMPSAMIILSQGAEEMEAIITADVLRRGGIDVTIAGLEGTEPVVCSRNVVIKPDMAFDEAAAKDFDVVVCPGGMQGSENMAASAKVGALLKKQVERDAYVAAICAAPIALKSHGIAKGKKLTSHPGVQDRVKEGDNYVYSDDRVVVDGKLVTSRGPGTAFEFALALVEILQGKEKKDSIVPPMLLKL